MGEVEYRTAEWNYEIVGCPIQAEGGEGQQGSWETGLNYECRSLLFKALHNLIERCLLSRDCVRLGKFFVQPHDGHEKVLGKNTYLSFSFAFFVHGESTVCASVDVREHPPVYNLTRQHLTAAQASTTGTPVILAPNGLAGNLTGVAFKNSDTSTSRFLEEWRKFYPIHSKFLVRDPDPALPPPVVEIIVGGVKMKYPSCYVLVTDMDDPGSPMVPTSCLLGKAPAAVNNKLNTAAASPPCSPCPNKRKPNLVNPSVMASEYHAISSGHHMKSMHNTQSAAVRMPEWVWQDSILNAVEPDNEEKQLGQWDFTDPTRKANCNCSK
ncbi:hypothetical protein RUM44_008605 [Polyplax serrata]|uniref:Mediator of RNA polymerase II transcription subunit 13 n=1 Tax=Polyplax serrata TaxID=468196 RepID=A0ABR1BCX9_POLSC